MAHQLVYIADDTEYNEAFADAVSRIGLDKWLQIQPHEEQKRIQQILTNEDLFINTVLTYREKLVQLYAYNGDEPTIKEQKTSIINSLRESLRQQIHDWDSKSKYQSWLDDEINNARLAIVSTYRSLLPDFMALYQRTNEDLGNFYEIISKLSRCQKDQRKRFLEIPEKINLAC